MRRIVTFKLKNGNSINVIADTTSDKEAKQLAIDNSNRLIREEAFMITKSTPVVHSETWEKGRKTQIQENSKIFNAAFYMNNITQFISIKANSVKNAYITIINKYGIQNNTFMIIYESNQCDKRKSALNESKKVIENEKEIQKICRCAINKSRKTEYIKCKDAFVIF